MQLIRESRSKSMPKLLKNKARTIMKNYPADAARALIYLLEKNGWKIKNATSQSFIRDFLERDSTYDASKSKWFDSNNYIDINFEDSEFREKMFSIRARLIYKNGDLYIESGADYYNIDVGEVDLDKSLEHVLDKIVKPTLKVANRISDEIDQGKGRYSPDLKDLLSKNEKSSLSKKVETISRFFEKKDFKLKLDKQSDGYYIRFTTTKFDDVPGIKKGMLFRSQFNYFYKQIDFIINRLNQTGYYLSKYGTDTDNAIWLFVEKLAPEKSSTKRSLENDETDKVKVYAKNKDVQEHTVQRLKTFVERVVEGEKIVEEERNTIKNIFGE